MENEARNNLEKLAGRARELIAQHKKKYEITRAALDRDFGDLDLEFEWTDHESEICLVVSRKLDGFKLYILPSNGERPKILVAESHEKLIAALEEFIIDYTRSAKRKVDKLEDRLGKRE